MNTLTLDFGPAPLGGTAPPVRRVPVREHLRRVRGDAEAPAPCVPEAAPFVKGSETSQAAAAAVDAEGSAAGTRGRILAALVQFGPMTGQEICERTGIIGDTMRPRRRELKMSGLIRQTGEKRKTRSGRGAELWEAVA